MEKAQKNNDRRSRTGTGALITGALAVAALLFVIALLALAACRPMLLQDIAGYVPVYSQVVGPEGGTVTDSRGASVEIPAGALAEETTITIATYSDGGDIYSRHGVTPFTGGANFGPDGIEFLKPVTITLPTSQKMVPGQTQPLFMLDPDTGAWDMTGFTLTAAADGWSATAEVPHFTPYVSSLLPPDALSKIEEFFDGTNGQVALGSYMAWFLTATNLYGYTTECSGAVYEVAGLFFDFTWQVDGVPGTAVSEYGDVSLDTVAQLNYSYDTESTDGPEYIYNMLITVYFDVTENPPEAEANISILEPVPGSTVEGIETISTYIVTGDSDIDIDSVAFYADGGLLGSDTEAPFQWYWDTGSLADGQHVLTATAAFSSGESVESEGVTVVVGEGEDEKNQYTVTFNSNGGTAVSSQIIEEGGAITEPDQAPIKTGYTFTGWYSDNEFTTLWDFENDTVSSNMTLHAGWTETVAADFEVKITAYDGDSGDYFGKSVSIDDDYAIVGSLKDDDRGDDSGAAYIFRRTGVNTWDAGTKITAPDGYTEDYFGVSVSIDGNYAIVGAYQENDMGLNAGAAYIFHRTGTNTWNSGIKITAPDGLEWDLFGYSVSISGNYAIIGAYMDDTVSDNEGSAYIFHRTGTNTWDTGTKITASDGAEEDLFGYSVSIDGDFAIIGAKYDDDYGNNSGSAYIFKHTGTNSWGTGTKITPPGGLETDLFGHSVSISGDRAIITAYKDDELGSNAGATYLFNCTDQSANTWDSGTKITASDGESSDEFGGAASANGDYAIVGSAYDDDNGGASGSAYIYYTEE
jgi:uncharacterized repeat protein (TIGR02543 family)